LLGSKVRAAGTFYRHKQLDQDDPTFFTFPTSLLNVSTGKVTFSGRNNLDNLVSNIPKAYKKIHSGPEVAFQAPSPQKLSFCSQTANQS